MRTRGEARYEPVQETASAVNSATVTVSRSYNLVPEKESSVREIFKKSLTSPMKRKSRLKEDRENN